jgi:hypothetical protein
MRLLVLATSNRDGRPIIGPVDGIFSRGRFHFGSSPDSLRSRHLLERPAVIATHLPGESLAVTVHGDAELLDVHAPEHAEFKQTILDIFTRATAASGRRCSTAEPGTRESTRAESSRSRCPTSMPDISAEDHSAGMTSSLQNLASYLELDPTSNESVADLG